MSGELNQLAYFAVFLAVAVIIGIAASYITQHSTGSVSARVLRDIRKRLASHIAGMPVVDIDQARSGELVARLNTDVNALARFLDIGLSRLFVQPLTAIIAFTVMLVIKWKLTVACFLITPVVIFSIERVSRIEGTIFKEILKKLGYVTSLIHDVISNISIVVNERTYFYRYRTSSIHCSAC